MRTSTPGIQDLAHHYQSVKGSPYHMCNVSDAEAVNPRGGRGGGDEGGGGQGGQGCS